ncbi:MAG: 50S ribosomal protein L3 [Firmicutes bacterium]|nr:50S ribosomal protein L3 [Bacillota bacterium]
MKKAILAKKLGMTQVFAENGTLIPVTVLQAGPCKVIQKKTVENDGYSALQVGFGELKPKHATKPIKGHYEARLGDVNAKPNKVLRELKLDDPDQFDVGAEIKADIFDAGEFVDISGVSKGKGYQGAIKRHGQHRGPMTHGSKYHRGLGSMGPGTTPGSVKKGKKMPGHMGAKKVSIQNIEVIRADADKNILLVKGPVPGAKNALLFVKSTVKK